MSRGPAAEDWRAAIAAAWPDLADGHIAILGEGFDCLALVVGDRVVVKLPLDPRAAAALEREAAVLDIVRPRVTLAVPDLVIRRGPPTMSRHGLIPGGHLLTPGYDRLSEVARDRLAEDLARFFAEVHALPQVTLAGAGAGPVGTWRSADVLIDAAVPRLPATLRPAASRLVEGWAALPDDPHGTIWGHFDVHGWNMAFDHGAGRLNGVYDFGDSGFGPLHREFVYPAWISFDLTVRIVGRYERLTGRALDLERIRLLAGILRLSEFADLGDDAELGAVMHDRVVAWLSD